jgi:transketolase
MNSRSAELNARRALGHGPADDDHLRRQGILKLLAIKDSDVRVATLGQCRDAVDKSLHAGGAFSATIPLVALYYGGFMDLDIVDPTKRGQDLFVLSKGHAVAALASIYADLGYFDGALLCNSRSHSSILNGHPGPVLPGVHLATGPMGQGLSVAQGLALVGRQSPTYDTYCLCGDGELQEGPIWEGVMYAGQAHLDNLCVMVDHNHGQLDLANRMVFTMPHLETVFESFGWEAVSVDATQYDGIYRALEHFRYRPRTGRPLAIICRTTKGHGALSDALNKHKVTVPDALIEQEIGLQRQQRRDRELELSRFHRALDARPGGRAHQEALVEAAQAMHLDVVRGSDGELSLPAAATSVQTRRVPPRNKRIGYEASRLPSIDRGKQYSAAEIVTAAMKVFARDPAVVSIDADLASTSGLEAGVAAVDQRRALNVGVAEANMLCIGEGYAIQGFNTWVSTFCPFFDWKVMRRVAVGHQERLEAIAAAGFETRTNGATHMGNDDNTIFDGLAHLKIVDASCPQQLLAIMRWIMEGNRGLVYLRVMRTPSPVLYPADYTFEFGKAAVLHDPADAAAVIVSSGRGVHEAMAAAADCAARGANVGVVDMSSIDEDLLVELCRSGRLICLAEQNNGYILQNLLKVVYRRCPDAASPVLQRIVAINTLGAGGRPAYIHSATYEELIEAYGLTAAAIAGAVLRGLANEKTR